MKAIGTDIERQIWDLLTDGTPVVVTSHVNLDGDGVGGALALWHALRGVGIECVQHYEAPMPSVFEFLPGLDERAGLDGLPERFHLAVIDCGDLARTGQLAGERDRAERIVNIDHHRTNYEFGHINYVDRDVSSSGELIYRILQAGGVPMTSEIAHCLYVAILTDTGGFAYSNTTPEALDICARLFRAGVRPWTLYEQLYGSPAESVVRLKGLTLGTLKLEADGRIATMQITDEMFRSTGTRPVDTQGFADLPISIANVEASALLKEIAEGGKVQYVKASLRSRPGERSVDMCSVAEAFGGGGHRHAAGCEFESTLAEAREALLGEIKRQLDAAQ